MTKEERLACLDRVKELDMVLPEGVEINSVTLISSPGVLLFGDFDFRDFAGSLGAEVTAAHYVDDKSDFISLHSNLFGFDVSVIICLGEPAYERELQQLRRREPSET